MKDEWKHNERNARSGQKKEKKMRFVVAAVVGVVVHHMHIVFPT